MLYFDHLPSKILSKPVSGDNVQKIIGAFQTIMPSATQSLNQISAKAADFSALGATTTTQLKNDLVVSGNLCLQLQNDINSIAPVSSWKFAEALGHAELTHNSRRWLIP